MDAAKRRVDDGGREDADEDAASLSSRRGCSPRLFAAILGMRVLLLCRLCSKLLEDTYTVSECGHQFCRLCIYEFVGKHTLCPTCSLPARVGRLVKNPKSDVLVACLKKLSRLYAGMFIPKRQGAEHEALQRTSCSPSVLPSCSSGDASSLHRSLSPTGTATSGGQALLGSHHASKLDASDGLDLSPAGAVERPCFAVSPPGTGRDSTAASTEKMEAALNKLPIAERSSLRQMLHEGIQDAVCLSGTQPSPSMLVTPSELDPRRLSSALPSIMSLSPLPDVCKKHVKAVGSDTSSHTDRASAPSEQAVRSQAVAERTQAPPEPTVQADPEISQPDAACEAGLGKRSAPKELTCVKNVRTRNKRAKTLAIAGKNGRGTAVRPSEPKRIIEQLDDCGANSTSAEPENVTPFKLPPAPEYRPPLEPALPTADVNADGGETPGRNTTKPVDSAPPMPYPKPSHRQELFIPIVVPTCPLQGVTPNRVSCIGSSFRLDKLHGVQQSEGNGGRTSKNELWEKLRNVTQSTAKSTTKARVLKSAQSPFEDRAVVVVLTSVPGDYKRVIEGAAEEQNSQQRGMRFTIHTGDVSDGSVSHVLAGAVVKENVAGKLCGRTLKYMYGLAQGLWIVHPEWLLDSLEAKTWLPEETYELEGDMIFGAKSEGPKKGRLRRKGFSPPLFKRCSFYLHGDFGPPNIGSHDLRKLLALSGATLLQRRPQKASGSSVGTGKRTPLDTAQPIVVIDPTRCNPRDLSRGTAWLAKCQVVSSVWVLDCISAGEVLIQQRGL